jgi:Skp family chaperone for outer membrane proteins
MMKSLVFTALIAITGTAAAAAEKSWWDSFKENIGIQAAEAKPEKADKEKADKETKKDADEDKADSDKAKKDKAAKDKGQNTQLSDADRAKLQAWMSQDAVASQRNGKGLPKGLQKKLERGGDLPPGWQRKIEKGDTLTEQEYEDAERIPEEIRAQIDLPEEVVEIIRVGDDVATVVKGGREIIDIIKGL